MYKFSNFKYAFLSILPIILLVMSCRKEIDLYSHCHDVHTFLRSSNATIPCGVSASFEGQQICLQGMIRLERDFFTGELSQVVLVSSHYELSQINIRYDESLKDALADFLNANRGVTTQVRGTILGFDKPQNFRCKRGFEIHIDQLSDFDFQ